MWLIGKGQVSTQEESNSFLNAEFDGQRAAIGPHRAQSSHGLGSAPGAVEPGLGGARFVVARVPLPGRCLGQPFKRPPKPWVRLVAQLQERMARIAVETMNEATRDGRRVHRRPAVGRNAVVEEVLAPLLQTRIFRIGAEFGEEDDLPDGDRIAG